MEVRAEIRRKGSDLNLFERKRIEEMRASGCSAEDIAREIGVHYVTIYRELHRGETGEVNAEGLPVYDAELAQMKAAVARANKGSKNSDGDGRARKAAEATEA